MTQAPIIRDRSICQDTYARACDAGMEDWLSRIIAGRVTLPGVVLADLLKPSLRRLDSPVTLPDIQRAADRLLEAISGGECIGIVTDYDVDGITSHTLIRECLVEDFGVNDDKVQGFIGHRLTEGYGLSEPVCERILAAAPHVVITADCGSSDEARIARLKQAGIDVIVTDHHGIPDEGVPASAFATVSPAREDSAYPDRAIAGCAVAWLLMCVLRNTLVSAGVLGKSAPKLTRHLDLVSLGTVADAVSLFSLNNRAFVQAGLALMNQRQRPCWQAVAELLERHRKPFTIDDLGFQIGPRINARGRMADPFAAWHFLAAKDLATAQTALERLDRNNLERRATEKKMVQRAVKQVEASLSDDQQVVVVYDQEFHAGVQGIVASRLLDAFGRVSCVLSPGKQDGELSGSLRSIDSVDVGAALKSIHAADTTILRAFGGHKAAAGVTLAEASLEQFSNALAHQVRQQISDQRLTPVILSDGEIASRYISFSGWQQIQELAPFGRGFEKPLFEAHFDVVQIRTVGAEPVHLSMQLQREGKRFRSIWFRALDMPGSVWPFEQGERVCCVFEIEPDLYRGGESIQLLVRYAYSLS